MAPEVFEYSEQELTGGRQQVQGDKLAGDDGPAGWGEWSLLRRPRACAGGRGFRRWLGMGTVGTTTGVMAQCMQQ
jgi:hypothetical protein